MTLTLTEKSPTQVHLLDDHDELYPLWKAQAPQARILVHLDEHSDFQWITEKDPRDLLKANSLQDIKNRLDHTRGWQTESFINRHTHLGNFLFRFFQEGFVDEWIWVIPTPDWRISAHREAIWKNFLDLYATRTGPMDPPVDKGTSFETKIFEVKVTVTCLENLRYFEEPVLLSLDVDYLTSEPQARPLKPKMARRRLPWIWPEELYSELRKKNIQPTHVAISHSVQGGFTPIGYKFFGETLQVLFEQGKVPQHYEPLKKAILLRHQEKDSKALDALHAFKGEGSLEVARCYYSAEALYDQGLWKEARLALGDAMIADAEFASVHNNLAPVYESHEMFREALEEHERMQVLMPEAFEPRLGEARCAAALGKRDSALRKLQALLRENRKDHRIHHLLGVLFLQKRSWIKARAHLEIARELRPDEPNLSLVLGIALFGEKKYEQAKKSFRRALELGLHTPLTYWFLSRTYSRLKLRKKARECLGEAFHLFWLIIKKKDRPWMVVEEILRYGLK